jgi:hypothetical protein
MRPANGGSTILLVHESNIQGNRKRNLEKEKAHVITHQHSATNMPHHHPSLSLSLSPSLPLSLTLEMACGHIGLIMKKEGEVLDNHYI